MENQGLTAEEEALRQEWINHPWTQRVKAAFPLRRRDGLERLEYAVAAGNTITRAEAIQGGLQEMREIYAVLFGEDLK